MASLLHPGGRAPVLRNMVPDHGIGEVKALHARSEKLPLHLALLADGLSSWGAGADVFGKTANAPDVIRKRRPIEPKETWSVHMARGIT